MDNIELRPAINFTDDELIEKQKIVNEEERRKKDEEKTYLIIYEIDNEEGEDIKQGFEFLEGRDSAISFTRGLVECYPSLLLDDSYIMVDTVTIDKRITLREFITHVNKTLDVLIPIDEDADEI